MIGDENADIPVFQITDNALNLLDSNRIDAGERFVQKNKTRVCSQSSGNLNTPPFTA
jgi:hypothetical protein